MTSLQKTISKIYWRNVKNRSVEFSGIKDKEVAAEVKRLAAEEVKAGKLPIERYKELIGEEYIAE